MSLRRQLLEKTRAPAALFHRTTKQCWSEPSCWFCEVRAILDLLIQAPRIRREAFR